MNERELQQLFAELIQAQGDALGLVVTALCKQVDPARLKQDLAQTIEGAKMLQSYSPVAVRIATHALAAADAANTLQAKPPSEGPHPTRG